MPAALFPGEEIAQAIDDLDHDDGEPALWLVLRESEARKIVAALESGHAYEVISILKRQPWWPDLSYAVRRSSLKTR